jgi:Uma2 family endonuclease
MSAATSPLSLEEFHRLYDGVKPYHEYWFGEAIPKPLANSLHGVVQFLLMLFLRAHGWNAASEVTLKLVPNAEPIPDVVAAGRRSSSLTRRNPSSFASKSDHHRIR